MPVRRVRLAEVLRIAEGQVDPTVDPYRSMPHVGGENIESVSGRLVGITSAEVLGLKSGKYLFRPGDVPYSKIRPALNKVAAVAFEGICSADIYPLRCNENVAAPEYLVHLLRSRAFLLYAAKHSTRTNIPKINREALRGYEVELPPLPEQRRIAAILDKADSIRRKRQQAIRLAADLLQSAYLRMVGPDNEDYAHWPVRRIEQLANPQPGSMRTGPFGSALRHSEFVEEGIAVLGIDNAVQNRFAWAERRFITREKYVAMARYTVKPGDVIITIMGTTGRSAVVPDDVPVAISTKHLATITVNRRLVHPEFLSNAIHRDPHVISQIESRNRGAIMAGLNLGLIRSLDVCLPPIDVQARFAAVIDGVRRLEARCQLVTNQVDHLFHSLVQRAFGRQL